MHTRTLVHQVPCRFILFHVWPACRVIAVKGVVWVWGEGGIISSAPQSVLCVVRSVQSTSGETRVISPGLAMPAPDLHLCLACRFFCDPFFFPPFFFWYGLKSVFSRHSRYCISSLHKVRSLRKMLLKEHSDEADCIRIPTCRIHLQACWLVLVRCGFLQLVPFLLPC